MDIGKDCTQTSTGTDNGDYKRVRKNKRAEYYEGAYQGEGQMVAGDHDKDFRII